MPKVLVNDENLTNIANAIREKNGETTTYKPSEMASAIQNISSGGSTPSMGIVINKYGDYGLVTEVTIVGWETIPEYYFYDFSSNDGAEGTYNLFGKIKKINLPTECVEIRRYAFYNNAHLEQVTLPNGLRIIGTYAFYNCKQLALTTLPDTVYALNDRVFYGCTGLTNFEVPAKVTKLENTFMNCSNLTKVVLKGDIKSISGSTWLGTFYGCESLETIIFNAVTSVPTMPDMKALVSTPIVNGTGYIYVPDALVDSFKSATNWSNIADQIKGISELEASA